MIQTLRKSYESFFFHSRISELESTWVALRRFFAHESVCLQQMVYARRSHRRVCGDLSTHLPALLSDLRRPGIFSPDSQTTPKRRSTRFFYC